MFQKLVASYGPFFILFFTLVSIIYGSGSRIDFDKMPDIRPRVLALFTEVPDGFVKVVDVADGDTIMVMMDGQEETVRLLGIDTPETRDPRRPVQCFGKEASNYTKELLLGKAVKLLTDPSETDRDKYDRLLRYVYLEDGTMINERLVYDGYAFVYDEYPTGRTEVLKKMEVDAMKNNRGLWGGCKVTEKKGGKGHSTNAVKE